MDNALEIKGLCKAYQDFALRDVSFTLPRGGVMGFIGENGAGKSTTIKSILNLIHRDAGEINIFGLDNRAEERKIKERLGIVMEDATYLNILNARQVNTLMEKTYPKWNTEQFFDYIKRFHIGEDKRIGDYSKGMRMKINIAAALSHEAELLIMDEPTSGLDPMVRDEVLDVFYDFMQDERHAILMSSHITSDLDKIADYITFIHQGKILFSESREALMCSCGLLRCTTEQLSTLDPAAVRAKRIGSFGCEALVYRDRIPEGWQVEQANIEQIMLLMTRGENVQ